LYLSKIRLTNFRLFEKLDLTLNSGLNVLVGENDSGKTSIIDAICFVLGTRSHDRRFLRESDFFCDSTELIIQLTFSEVTNHAPKFVEHLSNELNSNGDNEPVLHVQLRAWKTGIERRGYAPELVGIASVGWFAIVAVSVFAFATLSIFLFVQIAGAWFSKIPFISK